MPQTIEHSNIGPIKEKDKILKEAKKIISLKELRDRINKHEIQPQDFALIPKELHNEAVLMLIKSGNAKIVCKNLFKFYGLSEKNKLDLIYELVEANRGHLVSEYLWRFGIANTREKQKEIAKLVTTCGTGADLGSLAKNIAQYNHLNRNDLREIFLDLTAKGITIPVAKAMEKNLGHQEFQKELEDLIKNFKGEIQFKGKILEDFIESSQNFSKDIAKTLIKYGFGSIVMANIHRFEKLDQEIFEKFYIDLAIMRLNHFQGLNNETAHLVMDRNSQVLLDNLDSFCNLDSEIARSFMFLESFKDKLTVNYKSFRLDKEMAFTLLDAPNYPDDYKRSFFSIYRDFEKLPRKEARQIIRKVLAKAPKYANHFPDVIENFGLSKEDLKDTKTQKAYLKGLENVLRLGNYEENILEENFHNYMAKKELFGLDDEVLDRLWKQSWGQDVFVIHSLANKLGVKKDQYQKSLEETKNKVKESKDPMKIAELIVFLLKLEKLGDQQVCKTIQETIGQIDKNDSMEIIEKITGIAHDSSVLTYLKYFDLNKDSQYEEIYECLKSNTTEWDNEENINNPFEKGVEIFGYQKMLEYAHRKKISKHDALYSFEKILDIFLSYYGIVTNRNFDLTKYLYNLPEQEKNKIGNEFYHNILAQVKVDTGVYGEDGVQLSYHHLNEIAQNFISDFSQIFSQAKKYSNLEKLQKIVQMFETDRAQIFTSWNNLKKYHELCQLLSRSEILDQLSELKKQGKDKLYKYVETLAFHPGINGAKVIEFWQKPEAFLDIGEIHSAKTHELKKPSNYIEIPHLDLTPEDLRDALVEGKIDQLQSFEPLEIIYFIPNPNLKSQYDSLNTLTLIKKALGSRKNQIPGAARKPEKLFTSLTKLFKKWQIDYKKVLLEVEKIDAGQEKQLRNLVFDPVFGIKITEEYRAKINLKSDPDAVVAGNDTACCMHFGSGKNNVFTFNPISPLFTLQRKTNKGKWRTIAESVLTKDIDIGANFHDLLKKVEELQKQEHPPIHNILPEKILTQKQSILACDNVEVAPNAKRNARLEKIIEHAYRDFFGEYLKRYAKRDGFDDKKAVIGVGYSDSLTHLPQIENTFSPRAPLGYSDKTHRDVYKLDLEKPASEYVKIGDVKRKILVREKIKNSSQTTLLPKNLRGLSYLNFEDSLAMAFIEGKAYQDAPGMMEYLHNLENGLIAKDINNVTKNRANLSLKYEDETGKIRGYIFAYEGKFNKEGEPIIYISDLAADKKNKRAGGALILGFLNLYQKNYLERGNLIPIYFEARDETSYQIVKNQLDKIAERLGIVIEMEEKETYEYGGKTMHPVMLKPKKI